MEDEKDFSIFERKIVHIIYGPVCSNVRRKRRKRRRGRPRERCVDDVLQGIANLGVTGGVWLAIE
ncbi:hypothetical protein C0J52_28324 [Blattella germanica]|nr:hypothetical protein C0J52_28324 [Blattella germanica]